MISVIIPTYKSPDALDLCLRSAIETQTHINEIIVVVDGFYELNQDVLKKYSKHIETLDLVENVGLPRATNLGVYNASKEFILIVNDDNVFPKGWDCFLLETYVSGSVVSPNQIEPYPSMFKQFIIKDLGRNPSTFDLNRFYKYAQDMSKDLTEESGSTLPIFMRKIDYLKVGGWDESYPGPWVVDWEFFMKCEMNGMKMLRTYRCNFYHFVSLSTKTPQQADESMDKERECHEYFRYKWGGYAYNNPHNNSKIM